MSKDFSYRKTANSALNHLYNYTVDVSESHAQTSNRRLASGAAASVLGMGMNALSKNDVKDFNEYKDQLEREEKSGGRNHHHFTDRLLERMLNNVLADDDPDKMLLQQKFTDPDRARQPKLSIKILLSNFKTLAGRMTALFELQYGIIHVITWKRPTKTLSVLVLYTWLCLWPHLILAYPLLAVMLGVMVPGYLYRHPMSTPEFIKVKKRGQGLLEFFNQSDDKSIVEDYVGSRSSAGDDDEDIKDELYGVPPPEDASDDEKAEGKPPKTKEEEEAAKAEAEAEAEAEASKPAKKLRERRSAFSSQVTLLMNMRDLQNLTSDIIKGYDQGEIFWFQTAGFKDEALSTLIFYALVVLTSVVLFFGPYIPWRMIFIATGWIALILCHPNSSKHIKKIQQKPSTKRRTAEVKETMEKVERQDIIVDDAADVRRAEIFELHRRNITGDEWSFYLFSNDIFDCKDHSRIFGKRPTGVDHLNKIQPPKDWKFDIGYVNEWVIDTNPLEFIRQRSLDENDYIVPATTTDNEGWIYDNVDDSDESYRFRRRRLSRECFRYSRPVRVPKKGD